MGLSRAAERDSLMFGLMQKVHHQWCHTLPALMANRALTPSVVLTATAWKSSMGPARVAADEHSTLAYGGRISCYQWLPLC